MYYSVAGRTVLIKAFDDWSFSAVSQLFAGWFLTTLPQSPTHKPDLTLRIRCGRTPPSIPTGLTVFEIALGGRCLTDNSSFYLKFDNSLIVFGSDTSADVDLWVDQPYDVSSAKVAQLISHALSPAMRRCGVFEIHSAGVIPPDRTRAMMILGPSGSGKSTLTSRLAKCGWRYLSDDILLLQDCGNSLKVGAFRRFFALTAETLAAVDLPQGVFNESSGTAKERITPQEHFDSYPIEQATPGYMIFTNVTRKPQSRLVSLTSAEAMTMLLRLCPWASYDKPISEEHLRILARLANTSSAFALHAGTDILNEPTLAAHLIQKSIAKPALVGQFYDA
jgi:hypothetical protein